MSLLENTVASIRTNHLVLVERAQKRLDSLTKPLGSLGRLEDIAKLVVGISGKERPQLKNKVIFTFAADHGVTEEGVSAYPKEVTPQMVYNFLRGGAGINVLARHAGARVIVVDIGVAEEIKAQDGLIIKKIAYGTKNMTKGPAMTRGEALKSIETGIEVFEDVLKAGIDIVGTGEMGIGNTTASSAIASVLTGRSVVELTGMGTGIDEKSFINKVSSIRKAIEINKPDRNDPIDVLTKLGGFEIGGLAGIILSAAAHNVPVVIDGFISGAAALVAYHIEPKSKESMIASHVSVEKGHRIILDHIGLRPLLDLNLRLGEGTGAAIGIQLVEAGVKIYNEMATFQEAQVSEKKDL